jgi:hypothetical protein
MLKKLRARVKHQSPSIKAAFVFIVFVSLALVLPIQKSPVDIGSILSSTSIFYSILLGFYIAAAMANLSRLKTLVATETGALIGMYHIVKLSLPEKLQQTKDSIDTYLVKRFEYEVDNYTEPTTQEFFAIFDVLKGSQAK